MAYGIPQPQVFNPNQALQTGLQGAQALSYMGDRRRLLQEQAQARQQKAQGNLRKIFSTIDPESPDFYNHIRMAAGWFGKENPQYAQQAVELANKPEPELRAWAESNRKLLGIEKPVEKMPQYEMQNIYGPKDATKRVAIEKGTDYIPPKGWSLSKPKGKGIVVSYDEQGNPLISIGGQDIAKKTQSTLEGGVVSDLSSLQQMGNIEVLAKDSPDLFTYKSQLGVKKDIVLEKAGFAPDPEQEERMKRQQDLFMNVSQSFNTYRKEITGAAASEKELERLEQDYINAKMSHTQFMQALKTLKTKMERGLVLKQNLLQHGVRFNSKEYKSYFDSKGFPLKGKSISRPSISKRASVIKQQNPGYTSDKIYEILSDEGY